MQKKMLSLLLSLFFAVSCGLCSYADGSAELPPVRCVGVGDKAVITGSLDNAADDLGFITVFEGSSWESLRETEDYDMLKYVGEAAVDENGRFDITVGIVTSGEYRYEIKGFKKSDISASGKFYYINDSERSQASSEMKSIPLSDKAAATTMIARKVSQYKNAFGLFDGLYSEEALDGACEIIYNSIKDIKNEDVSLCVNKAFTAALLNSGKISDVGDYEFSLGLEASGLEKYYKKSESLTKKLAAEKYTSTQQFDKKLMASLIGISIEYSDGTQAIEDLIKMSSDYLEAEIISKALNSDTIIKSMINESDKSKFYTFDGISAYISAYTEPKNNSGSGNGSGGGGGVSHGSGNVGGGTKTMPLVSPEKPQEHSIFSDVGNDYWAKDMIEDLYRRGIVAGKTETEFYPEDNITREEFVKLLVASINIKADGRDISFSDVSQDDWFYPYVYTAYNAEVVKGISDDMFGAGLPITRQDLTVMAYNAISVCEINIPDNAGTSEFNDEGNISEYAKKAVSVLKNAGIISGDENGNFRPSDSTTRAEAAKIIYTVLSFN